MSIGLQDEKILVNRNFLIKQSTFVGFRDGCIYYYSENYYSEIKFCIFLDNSIDGKSGGAIDTQNGKDVIVKINSCFASSCYTIPSDSFCEGQFMNLRSTGESSSIEVSNLCVFQCAPFIISSPKECQRASIFFGQGCYLASNINFTNNKADWYTIFFCPYAERESKYQYITVVDSENSKFTFGNYDRISKVNHCNIINNRAIHDSGWAAFYYNTQIIFTDCAFKFPRMLGFFISGNITSIDFVNCYIVNMDTTKANSISTVNSYDENVHVPIRGLFDSMKIFDIRSRAVFIKTRMSVSSNDNINDLTEEQAQYVEQIKAVSLSQQMLENVGSEKEITLNPELDDLFSDEIILNDIFADGLEVPELKPKHEIFNDILFGSQISSDPELNKLRNILVTAVTRLRKASGIKVSNEENRMPISMLIEAYREERFRAKDVPKKVHQKPQAVAEIFSSKKPESNAAMVYNSRKLRANPLIIKSSSSSKDQISEEMFDDINLSSSSISEYSYEYYSDEEQPSIVLPNEKVESPKEEVHIEEKRNKKGEKRSSNQIRVTKSQTEHQHQSSQSNQSNRKRPQPLSIQTKRSNI